MNNIYQRINEIRKEVSYIKKDSEVSTGGGKYKAVSHDNVTAILRDHMVKAGIVCIPTLLKSITHPKEEGAKQSKYEATYKFTFVNADQPTDTFESIIEAHAMDNADKAPGKALSYAKKMCLLKLFELESGDDDEGRYAEEDIGEIISDDDVTKILDLFAASKADSAGFCKFFKIAKVEDMRTTQLPQALGMLEKKLSEAKVEDMRTTQLPQALGMLEKKLSEAKAKAVQNEPQS